MSANATVFDPSGFPADLVNLVLNSCDWQSLCQLARVSKAWTTFLDDSQQWQIKALALGIQSSSALECREKIQIYYAWHLSEQEIKILISAEALASTRRDPLNASDLFSACYKLSMDHDGTKNSSSLRIIKNEVLNKERLKNYLNIIDACSTINKTLSSWFSFKDAELLYVNEAFPNAESKKQLEIKGFSPPRQVEVYSKEAAKGLKMFLHRFAMVIKWVKIKKLEKQIQDITNQPENQISLLTLKTKKLKVLYLEAEMELERALKQTGPLEATTAKPPTPPIEKPPESGVTDPALRCDKLGETVPIPFQLSPLNLDTELPGKVNVASAGFSLEKTGGSEPNLETLSHPNPAPIQKSFAKAPKSNEGRSFVSSILACLFSFITWMGNCFSSFFSR